MKYLQKLGKSFVLPISSLPIASILIGLGYFLQNIFINQQELNFILALAKILIISGNVIIENIPILFVIGVSMGMSKHRDGISIISGLISWFIFQTVLQPEIIQYVLNETNQEFYFNSNNTLLAIISGIISANCYNKFRNIEFKESFAFFGGKRFVVIITTIITISLSIVLLFIWPFIDIIIIKFVEFIRYLGSFGAGIYGFLNRILIPTGLHHSLNIVFWFDTFGINDLGNFWLGNNINGQTGIFMTGFYPITMFALPVAALAMYNTAKEENKKHISKILLSAAICSFFTGVTETIEFAFIFISPWLYLIHSILTGISMFVCALFSVRAGFNFSSGFIDLIFSSTTPLANNIIYIIPIGLIFAILYYFIFKTLILKFNLKTLGRDSLVNEDEKEDDFKIMAEIIMEGLGGEDNIKTIDNCITRLRIEVKDTKYIDEEKIKECKISGIFYPSKTNIHIVVGQNAQFIANELKKLNKK